MVGSKLLISLLLILLILFYMFMDINLYLRIQNYPIDRYNNDNFSLQYNSWLGCDLSPLCDVTVKGLLLDHTNHYLFAPLATLVDRFLDISHTIWITPNIISITHVFIAIFAAKMIASDTLALRRIGVILFEMRTFLDDMDGHVARARKHIKGERSEIGTSGYYIDGICDLIGCIALMLGTFVFLKTNPPRRGYMPLTAILPGPNKETGSSSVIYKAKVTTKKVARKICCFSAQLLISSTAWNRYIALYQDMLERNDVTKQQFIKQNITFKSSVFFAVVWLWRLLNLHNMIHCLLLAIFCDKLWEFLRAIQYMGFVILICVICVSEMHVIEVENYIFNHFTGNTTNI